MRIVAESAASAAQIVETLESPASRLPMETTDSIQTQLAWLLFRGFPRVVPLAQLRHYARYLKGAAIRLERARTNPSGDRAKEERLAPYWQRYQAAVSDKSGTYDAVALAEYRWMVEEYRVSLFAQELHTPQPVSPKRLDALFTEAGTHFCGSAKTPARRQ